MGNRNILDEAAALYEAGQFEEARELYKQLALDGRVECQRFLGWMYMRGDGVESDLDEAIDWFYQAAQMGDVEAQFGLARAHMARGDYAKSLQWYTESSDHGFMPSTYWLGRFYKEGVGVRKDIQTALRIFKENAKRGHVRSLKEWSLLLVKGYGGIESVPVGLFLYLRFLLTTLFVAARDPRGYRLMI